MIHLTDTEFPKLYNASMSYNDLKKRLEKIYKKLNIKNIHQAAGVLGYSPYRAMISFKTSGVSPQAQIILQLLEAIPEKELHSLIKEINNGN